MGSTHVAVPGHADGFRCALPILRCCGAGGADGFRCALPILRSRCGSAGIRRRIRDALLRMLALLQGQCMRSEEHTSELQSLMRISYAVFCLKKKTKETKLTR